MIDALTGSLSYTTLTDGSKFYRQFVPNWDINQPPAYGMNVMFQVESNDNFPCTIMNIEPEMFIYKGLYLPVGGA
jgi:hypothetical protein